MRALTLFILLSLIFTSCIKSVESKHDTGIVFKDIESNRNDTIDLNTFNKTFDIDTVIPDKSTAIKYAFIILSNVYGEQQIRGEFPLNISREKSNWIVTGSLPKNSLGGTAFISIDAKSGTVNKIIHYK